MTNDQVWIHKTLEADFKHQTTSERELTLGSNVRTVFGLQGEAFRPPLVCFVGPPTELLILLAQGPQAQVYPSWSVPVSR